MIISALTNTFTKKTGNNLLSSYHSCLLVLLFIANNVIASTKIPQKVDGLIQEATSKEQKGNYNEAIIFYKKALTSLQKNQSAETGKIYFLLGNNFFYLGQSDSSINYYYKALAIGEKLNNAEILARSHQGIGSIYHEQKKYAEALLERTKAVQWARLVANNPSVLSSTLVAQALSNFWLKNYTKAMEIYQEVIPIALKINDYKSLRTVHMNIAAIHLELNIRKPILGYINKSLYYSALMKNPYYDCETNMLVGIFYWRLGEPEKAIAQLKQSVKMGKKINARSHLKRVYDSLAVIYTSKNDYKEALHYFKQSASLKDSIQSEKTLKHIKELEVKYHSVQKDKELAQKQLIIAQKDLQLKQKSKWILIPVIGIVLLTIISVFIFFYYKNKMKFHQQTLMLLEKDREISLLEAMMQGEETERGRIARDLHDGIGGLLSAAKMQFSVLKNTNGTTNHKAEFENGLHLLDESASEIRKTAHNLLPELLNRFGLEEGVFNYCQRVSTNKLRIDFVCMSEIPRLKQSFELTIYRIIQELVNNCIKHSDAREALVQLSCYQNFLVITVEDNGKGFTYQLGQMDGIGLDQIHSKINSVNGNIKIDSTEKGTTVYIEFDIEKLLITKEDIS